MKLGDNGEAFFVQGTEQHSVSFMMKLKYFFVVEFQVNWSVC